MTTTSGRSRGAASTASRPLAASPTTSIPSSSARIIRKPVRTSCLVVDQQDADAHAADAAPSIGRRAVTTNPVAVGWATQRAAQHRRPLPHPDQAAALVRRLDAWPARPGPRSSATVISRASDGVAHDHARVAAARVLERVRERLLDDPVGGDLEARVERALVALDHELHGETGGPELVQQLVEAVEPGRRVRGLLLAQDPEHPAHVGQREAPGGRDRLEGRPGLVRALVDDAQRAARLDHDHAHVVRDHVVQLAGDPLALVADGALGPLVALALEPLRALLERARVQPADPRRVAEQPRDDRGSARSGRASGRPPRCPPGRRRRSPGGRR